MANNISFGYPIYPVVKFQSANFNNPNGTYLSDAIDYISNYIKAELNNVTKAYLVGTTNNPNSEGKDNTIYDSGIYITPEAGTMTAKRNNYFNETQSYGYSGVNTVGTTSTQGISKMVLGNNLATGTDNNARGEILLYGNNTGYTNIVPGANSNSNITLTLPSSTGTVALTSSNITGNAGTATKLATARTFSWTNDATGSLSFDGSQNVSAALTLKNSGVTAANYGPTAGSSPGYGGSFSVPYFSVDAKGRITSAANRTITLPASDNTWRPVVDNLTSTATDQSLSANQGRILKGLVDGKSDAHSHPYASSSHTHDDRYYTESEVNNLLKGKSDTHSHPYASSSHNHNLSSLNGITISQTAPSNPSDGHIWISW